MKRFTSCPYPFSLIIFPVLSFIRELKHLRWQRLRKGHSKSEFVLFIPSRLIRQMLAKFFGVKFYRIVFQCSKKGKGSFCLVFLSSTKREIRHFHIVVVQRRHRNVQKSVMHVHSCCFANLNQLPFCRSRWRRGTIWKWTIYGRATFW